MPVTDDIEEHLVRKLTEVGEAYLIGWLAVASRTNPAIREELERFVAWERKRDAVRISPGLKAFK